MTIKHLIFGGSGFVGKHLSSKLLDSKQDFTIIDIKKPQLKSTPYVAMDICKEDKFSLLDNFIDENTVIYHLASRQYHEKYPRVKSQIYFDETNVQGTENILNFCASKKCKGVILFSTDMIYGIPKYCPLDSKHPQSPISPYGKSKRKAEQIALKYRKKGLHITILRPTLIMGPGRLGIFKKIFKYIKNNKPIPIIGNGNNSYQMISVFDCISAMEKVVEKGIPNKEFNLGSINPSTVNTLLNTLIKKKKSSSKILSLNAAMAKFCLNFFELIGRPILYKDQYMIANYNYITEVQETIEYLDWEPKYNDIDMIIQAYEHYIEHKNE